MVDSTYNGHDLGMVYGPIYLIATATLASIIDIKLEQIINPPRWAAQASPAYD